MSVVNRTFPAIPDSIRDWTRFLSSLFFARSFECSLIGCTTTPTATARYTASAGIVCLSIPDLSATSNSVNTFLAGLPADITPQHDQPCIARIIDNGVTAAGIAIVGLDGSMTLTKDLSGTSGTFTAAGTKGIRFSNVVYPLD